MQIEKKEKRICLEKREIKKTKQRKLTSSVTADHRENILQDKNNVREREKEDQLYTSDSNVYG